MLRLAARSSISFLPLPICQIRTTMRCTHHDTPGVKKNKMLTSRTQPKLGNLDSLLDHYKLSKESNHSQVERSRIMSQSRHYLRVGRWMDAIKLIDMNRSILEPKLSPHDSNLFQTLFNKALRFQDQIHFSLDLFNHYPDHFDWKKLVTWLCRHLMTEKAQDILLQHIKPTSTLLDKNTLSLCRKIMMTLARNDATTSSFTFFWRVINKTKLSSDYYLILSKALVDVQLTQHNVSQAQEFVELNFTRFGIFDLASYHAILEHLYLQQQFRKASIWRSALSSKFSSSESKETKYLIIKCLLRVGRRKDAMKVIQELPETILPPSVHAHLISYHFGIGQVNQARRYFKEHLSQCRQENDKVDIPSDECLKALVTGYLRFWPRYNGDIMRLQSTFQLGARYPNTSVILAIGYLENASLSDAQRIIKKLPEKPPALWNALISHFAKEGNLKEAENQLSILLQNTQQTKESLSTTPFVALMDSAIHHFEDYKLVEKYWGLMKDAFVSTDAEVFDSLMNAKLYTGDASGAWETMKSFLRMGGVPSFNILCTLMNFCGVLNNPDLIQSFYQELLRFNGLNPVLVMNSAIRSYGFCGHRDKALVLWNRLWRSVKRVPTDNNKLSSSHHIMKTSPENTTFGINSGSVDAILWTMGKSRDKETVIRIWNDLVSSRFNLSISNKEQYVLSLLECEAVEEATVAAMEFAKDGEIHQMKRMLSRLWIFLEANSLRYPNQLSSFSEWILAYLDPSFRRYLHHCRRTLRYPRAFDHLPPQVEEVQQKMQQLLSDVKARNVLWISPTECVTRRIRNSTRTTISNT